jgi:hypothetical protein
VAVAVAWVVGLGWMVDPNISSLHKFYRARLVRAYLGASNQNRDTQEITDSAEGDDVRLADLCNTRYGAPYHLINTTLNLVGGRDLSTSQRSSDGFVLSQEYCGRRAPAFAERPGTWAASLRWVRPWRLPERRRAPTWAPRRPAPPFPCCWPF